MCLLFQAFLFILKLQGDRAILNVSEFTAQNQYVVEDKPFFQYTLFWTSTCRIIKVYTLMFVHNFVVYLKGVSLSCKSHFFVWKIHRSFTLPVHFSFCRCSQKGVKQWRLSLSKSSLDFGEKYCLHVFRISCCAQNSP